MKKKFWIVGTFTPDGKFIMQDRVIETIEEARLVAGNLVNSKGVESFICESVIQASFERSPIKFETVAP